MIDVWETIIACRKLDCTSHFQVRWRCIPRHASARRAHCILQMTVWTMRHMVPYVTNFSQFAGWLFRTAWTFAMRRQCASSVSGSGSRNGHFPAPSVSGSAYHELFIQPTIPFLLLDIQFQASSGLPGIATASILIASSLRAGVGVASADQEGHNSVAEHGHQRMAGPGHGRSWPALSRGCR